MVEIAVGPRLTPHERGRERFAEQSVVVLVLPTMEEIVALVQFTPEVRGQERIAEES